MAKIVLEYDECFIFPPFFFSNDGGRRDEYSCTRRPSLTWLWAFSGRVHLSVVDVAATKNLKFVSGKAWVGCIFSVAHGLGHAIAAPFSLFISKSVLGWGVGLGLGLELGPKFIKPPPSEGEEELTHL